MRPPRSIRPTTYLTACALLLTACSAPDVDPSADAGADALTTGSVVEVAADLVARFPELDDRIAELEVRAADEGPVTLYTNVDLEMAEPLAEAFRRDHPTIDMEFVRLDGNALLERLRAESAAGRPQADVVLSQPLILANLDADGLLTAHRSAPVPSEIPAEHVEDRAVTVYVNPEVIAWNTDLVSSAVAPTEIDDLLAPELAGCALHSRAESQIAALLLERGEAATIDWLDAFVANDGQIRESRSAMPPALAAGDLGCIGGVFVHWIEALKAEGAPVDWAAPQPTPSSNISVSLHAESRHPHAALLLMHWLLGPGAAEVIADNERIPVHPSATLRYEAMRGFVTPGDPLAESLLVLSPEVMAEIADDVWRIGDEHLRGPLAGR